MKTLLISICCLAAFNAFAQTTEAISEERSSAWIKVAEDPFPASKPATVKKKTTTATKKKPVHKPTPQNQNMEDEFEKTNSQVNRFKKQQKG